MNGKDYQQLAMRTNDGRATERLLRITLEDGQPLVEKDCDIGGILNGCLGLSGEVGEFTDMVKKWIFHEKPLDNDHAQKEIGDVMWYIAMICFSFGWDMGEIMQKNIDKLKARYPDGFNVELSANRRVDDV